MPESKTPEITRASTLIEKLAWIISDLPQLQKRGWNVGQKFNFISVEQMKREILPRCAKLGIICYPYDVRTTLSYRDRVNDSGHVYGLSTEYQLITKWIITDGKDTLDPAPETIGEAIDVQDKAGNKASTGSLKNLFKTAFGITENEDDNDANTPVAHGESTRRAPPPKPKRDLTDAQKEFLGLKDQAVEAVQKLGRLKMIDPDDVVKGLISEGRLAEEFQDASHIKHRAQARELIDAVEKYISEHSLEDPS